MSKRRIHFVMRTLNELTSEFGLRYEIDQEVGQFGYLTFPNGVRHYVSRGDIRVNAVGPHLIANDKYHTDKFLKDFGYPVIPSKIFYSERFQSTHGFREDNVGDAITFADRLGYPVIVKPNNGLHGNGVHKAYDAKRLESILPNVFKQYDKVLVQQYAEGSDYRIIIYRGKFISAYRRIPLTVVGDGERSILQFLEDRRDQAIEEHRSVNFDLEAIGTVLKRKGKKLMTIPEKGEEVVLLDNSNLSTGGYAEDVTNIIHKDFIDAAVRAVEDLNLNLAGVDLIVNGDITKAPDSGSWFFLEVNASPGFDWYSRLGDEQHKRILNLFREILGDIRDGNISQ